MKRIIRVANSRNQDFQVDFETVPMEAYLSAIGRVKTYLDAHIVAYASDPMGPWSIVQGEPRFSERYSSLIAARSIMENLEQDVIDDWGTDGELNTIIDDLPHHMPMGS